MKVLFICTGNVGRSQMAEAIFNKLCEGRDQAISAGTKVNRGEINKEGEKISDPNVVEVMKEIGLDISLQMRNQLTPEMVKEVNKVIFMAEQDTAPDYIKQNKKAVFWGIPDPHNQSLEFTRQVRDQLRMRIEDFVNELSSEIKLNTSIKLH